MKTSILASGLALCALAPAALASPLEARDGKARTVTTTETDVITKWRTRTKTETDTLMKTKTKTKTVVSSTTVTVHRPTTVTKSSVSTMTVQHPTTVTKYSEKVLTATVTAQGPTTTAWHTKTMQGPSTVSTQTVQGSTVTTMSTIRGPTVTAPGQTVTVHGPTVTVPGKTVTSLSTQTIPGPTITDISITTIQGPTITAVSTIYVNNETDITSSKSITSWLASASASSTSLGLDAFNMTSSANSSSAAATATAESHINVITTQCANPKAYYIQVDNSGTKIDGTVLLNENPNAPDSWVDYYPPGSAASLSPMLPQPFIFDNSSGMLTSYWYDHELLGVNRGGGQWNGDGLVASTSMGCPLKCTLVGNVLTNCTYTVWDTSFVGLKVWEVEPDGEHYLWATGGYDYPNLFNATLTLIPACDL